MKIVETFFWFNKYAHYQSFAFLKIFLPNASTQCWLFVGFDEGQV